MKNKTLLALVLALMLMLTAVCGLCESTEDPILATAYDGEITITDSEAQYEFDQMLAYYLDMYAQYGYTIDEYDTEFQSSVAQETVYNLLARKILTRYAEDKGYVLTEEAEAEMMATVETTLDGLREYLESMYAMYYGYSGDELSAIVEEELVAYGYTVDTLFANEKIVAVEDYLYEIETAGITVTEEEVKAAFDAAVEEEIAGGAEGFVTNYLSGVETLWVPDGMRLVQCIYVALDATADAAAAENTETDPANLTGLAKANAIKAKLDAGEDWETLMVAYNEDGATAEQLGFGYPVSTETTSYGEEFMNTAMALATLGDVSDVLTTSYGYFIIKYVADIPAGAVDFETVKEAQTEAALTAKKDEAFTNTLNDVVETSGVVLIDPTSLFHVYVAEVVEATIAYVTVNADTVLTDMPAGDAVANLAAGASLDVLGHIGVDGEEYAFVAVPGTEFKGYVNVTAVTAADAEAALAVDNAALATAVAVEGKNPIFTIAMNDGSLIYGELYPEIAPESVGNFISLANSSFYDGLIFHRVIAGFMIQGGDPNGTGTGGPGYAIKGEFSENGVENNLSHTRGVLSMARSSAMDSAGSQFFIMHADSTYLDGSYAAFGAVLGGIETVDVIASVPTDSSDKPMTEQTMRTVYVETYGNTYEFTKLED